MNPPRPPKLAQCLASLYRFAFLLTGSEAAAAEVFDLTIEHAACHFADFRCPRRAARWLFVEARAHCRRRHPAPVQEETGDAATEPQQLAAAFAPLPEPERCALALFYLFLFPAAELAETLAVSPAELSALLSRGRALLRRHPVMAGLKDTGLAPC